MNDIIAIPRWMIIFGYLVFFVFGCFIHSNWQSIRKHEIDPIDFVIGLSLLYGMAMYAGLQLI